jgi:hypothetical protein
MISGTPGSQAVFLCSNSRRLSLSHPFTDSDFRPRRERSLLLASSSQATIYEFYFWRLDAIMMSNVRRDVRTVDDLDFGCSVFARFLSLEVRWHCDL